MPKILVVDDEAGLRVLYEKELLREGYQIELASSGKEAISKVKNTAFDLIILDIKMPEMNGIEVLNKIMNINNKIPIILNSAYASFKDNFSTWAADAYIVKSSDFGELKDAVAKVLKEKAK